MAERWWTHSLSHFSIGVRSARCAAANAAAKFTFLTDGQCQSFHPSIVHSNRHSVRSLLGHPPSALPCLGSASALPRLCIGSVPCLGSAQHRLCPASRLCALHRLCPRLCSFGLNLNILAGHYSFLFTSAPGAFPAPPPPQSLVWVVAQSTQNRPHHFAFGSQSLLLLVHFVSRNFYWYVPDLNKALRVQAWRTVYKK